MVWKVCYALLVIAVGRGGAGGSTWGVRLMRVSRCVVVHSSEWKSIGYV